MELIKKNNFYEFKKITNNVNYKRILVICGKNSFKLSGAKKLITKILDKNTPQFFFKKNKLPEYFELVRLINVIKKVNPNLIIAIGGGAVMDLAKIANVLYGSNNLKNEIINNTYKTDKIFCDLISIPTTAGSGAEVTSNAVIYIKKKKYSIEGDNIKPKHAALFPELILSNNKKITYSSAFDALSQAIESLISVNSNNDSIVYSKKAIKIFLNNYKKYIENRNLEKTFKISLSAFYAGKAISITKTTAPHAVSYPFTSYFNISHGHAVSLTLIEFLQFNYLNIKNSVTKFNLLKRYDILFSLFGARSINELSIKLKLIKEDLELNDNFNQLNKNIIKKIDLIVDNVNVQRLTNNPVKVKKIDILNILIKKINKN